MAKIGKMIVNHKNIGVALLDIEKIDSLGGNKAYFLDDFRLLTWQPSWLKIEDQKK